LRDWLLEERIYDHNDGEVKPIHMISKAFHDKLKHYTILFRVFANREQLDPAYDTRNTYNNEKTKICRATRNKIEGIEDAYEKLS